MIANRSVPPSSVIPVLAYADVADAGHVREDAFILGQQARGKQRQRRVLVTLDGDAPAQAMAAFNQ